MRRCLARTLPAAVVPVGQVARADPVVRAVKLVEGNAVAVKDPAVRAVVAGDLRPSRSQPNKWDWFGHGLIKGRSKKEIRKKLDLSAAIGDR
jgi:hypothetical protein